MREGRGMVSYVRLRYKKVQNASLLGFLATELDPWLLQRLRDSAACCASCQGLFCCLRLLSIASREVETWYGQPWLTSKSSPKSARARVPILLRVIEMHPMQRTQFRYFLTTHTLMKEIQHYISILQLTSTSGHWLQSTNSCWRVTVCSSCAEGDQSNPVPVNRDVNWSKA